MYHKVAFLILEGEIAVLPYHTRLHVGFLAMSPAPSSAQIRTLYQNTLAASKRFSSYNFAQYFTRRTQQTFEPYLQSDDKIKAIKPEELAKFYQQQSAALEVLRRSGELNRMYEGPQLVIEHALPITGMCRRSRRFKLSFLSRIESLILHTSAGGGDGAEASP